MPELIHLAGPVVTFETVQRQRCAWCGALIEERDLANMAVALDSTASDEVNDETVRKVGELRWEGLVAIDGNFRHSVDDPEDGKAPERSCFMIPAEVTG